MSSSVTIKTVAAAAGVSFSAVSLALRNHPSIPPATRERIRLIADQLGYHRNVFASVLGAAHGGKEFRATLACLVGHKDRNPLKDKIVYRYLEAIKGARQRAHEQGYELEVIWRYEAGLTARRIAGILAAKGVPGIMLLALHSSEVNLDWELFSCATVGRYPNPDFHYAWVDRYRTVQLAGMKAISMGYRRPGLVAWPGRDDNADQRMFSAMWGIQDSLGGSKVPALKYRGVMEDLPRWYKKHRPDFILSSEGGKRPLKFLNEAGLAVPGDVGLAVLDVDPGNEQFSGVRFCHGDIGAAAIDLVISQLYRHETGHPARPQGVVIEPEWIAGETMAKVEQGCVTTAA